MARSIDLKDCTIVISDGTTPTANTCTVTLGDGNLTFSEKKQYDYLLDKGELDDVRRGDEVPMEVSLEAKFTHYKGVTPSAASASSNLTAEVTPVDALNGTGSAAAWVSSDSDACRPYAVDITLTNDPTCTLGNKEVFLFPDFRLEDASFDVKAGTISFSGKCNATRATVTRTRNTTLA